MGAFTDASGNYSTALGHYTTAPSYGEVVVGCYNTTYTPNSATSWNTSDRLFVVGNGSSSSNTSDALVVLKSGLVGIGTNSPENGKLEVTGSVSNYFSGDYTYHTAGGARRTESNSREAVSIYADGFIAGFRCLAHSDERIKTNRQLSDNESDLELLMKVRVTNYEFVDQLVNGSGTEKKVIAQELKEVYPEAVVDNITQVVPDIMQFAPAKDGWITLADHGLAQGDIVRLVYQDGANEFEVLEVQGGQFKVAYAKTEKLLVYGRQVDDFHTVDYDAMAMLNISATQAQQQHIEALEAEVKALKAEKQATAQQLAQLQADQASTQTKLAQLEALIQQQLGMDKKATALSAR